MRSRWGCRSGAGCESARAVNPPERQSCDPAGSDPAGSDPAGSDPTRVITCDGESAKLEPMPVDQVAALEDERSGELCKYSKYGK